MLFCFVFLHFSLCFVLFLVFTLDEWANWVFRTSVSCWVNAIIWDWCWFSVFVAFIVFVKALKVKNLSCCFCARHSRRHYTLFSLTFVALFFHPRMTWGQPQTPLLPSSPLLPLAYSAAPAVNPPPANAPRLTPLTLTCTPPHHPNHLAKTTNNSKTLLMSQRKSPHWLSSPWWVSTLLVLSRVFNPPTGWNPLQHRQSQHHLPLLQPWVQKNQKPLPHRHPPTSTLSWWRCTGPTQSLMSMRSDRFLRAEVRRCSNHTVTDQQRFSI